jgi:pectate lyase-like protein
MKKKTLRILGLLLAMGGWAQAKTVHVAPNGADGAAGTADKPLPLAAALGSAAAGDTILMKGGVYAFAAQLTIDRARSGAAGKRICLFAQAGEKPVLDFSSQPYAKEGNPRGLQIDGSYWHVRGLEVKGSADNGIYVSGSHNVVESCVTHKNRDSGLQIGRWKAEAPSSEWPADNLILNCESFDNYDSPPGGGENADGFACKLTSGPGNVFRGCVSHHNIDDGWDLYTKEETGPIGTVVLDQCIAYANGSLTDGTSNENGDRNGFKLGGADIAVVHVVTRCVAFRNGKNGFTWNSNPGAMRISNNLAFDNAEGNFNFGTNSVATAAVFTNNISFWTSASGAASDKHLGTDAANSNCWWDKSAKVPSVNGKGLVVTAADFAASLSAPKVQRRADGSPDMDAFRLAAGSKLINAGAAPSGELPFEAAKYYVGAPDLGAVEAGTPLSALNPVQGMRAGPGARALRGSRGPVWLAPERAPGAGSRNAAGRSVPERF